MYINSVVRLFRGGLRPITFTLPSPVTFHEKQAEVRTVAELPDNRLLVIPLTYETPTCEAIATLSDRVGGSLNGRPVEIGVRNIRVVGDEIHIPFFALEGEVPIGMMTNVVLIVEII